MNHSEFKSYLNSKYGEKPQASLKAEVPEVRGSYKVDPHKKISVSKFMNKRRLSPAKFPPQTTKEDCLIF
jgi:hypothetical protein